MRNTVAGVLLAAVAIAVFVGVNAAYVVNETQQALVLRFGEPQGGPRGPGLHFKAPFIDNVVYLDERILELDIPAQEVIAADQKRLVVDAFARYQIVDPLLFFQTVSSIEGANNRLTTFVNSSMRRVIGESSFEQVVRDQRSELMARIRDQVNNEASSLGLQVVDVKLRRADLPEANSQAIFSRMQTERQREAAEIRAQGEEIARRIRGTADRNVTVVIANANRDAERLRGEGDATANGIYAEAYGRDADFFAFYRSMRAYENGLQGDDTRLVLSPTSDFFRYFSNPMGAARAGTQPGGPAGPVPQASVQQ